MIVERRVTLFMAFGAMFFCGWISGAAYFRVHQLWLTEDKYVRVETTDVPKLQTQVKQANCDKQELAGVAAQGIAAANTDNVAAPNWSDLHGCATVAPVKAPPLSKVLPK